MLKIVDTDGRRLAIVGPSGFRVGKPSIPNVPVDGHYPNDHICGHNMDRLFATCVLDVPSFLVDLDSLYARSNRGIYTPDTFEPYRPSSLKLGDNGLSDGREGFGAHMYSPELPFGENPVRHPTVHGVVTTAPIDYRARSQDYVVSSLHLPAIPGIRSATLNNDADQTGVVRSSSGAYSSQNGAWQGNGWGGWRTTWDTLQEWLSVPRALSTTIGHSRMERTWSDVVGTSSFPVLSVNETNDFVFRSRHSLQYRFRCVTFTMGDLGRVDEYVVVVVADLSWQLPTYVTPPAATGIQPTLGLVECSVSQQYNRVVGETLIGPEIIGYPRDSYTYDWVFTSKAMLHATFGAPNVSVYEVKRDVHSVLKEVVAECDLKLTRVSTPTLSFSTADAVSQASLGLNGLESLPELPGLIPNIRKFAGATKDFFKLLKGDLSKLPRCLDHIANAYLYYKFGAAPSFKDGKVIVDFLSEYLDDPTQGMPDSWNLIPDFWRPDGTVGPLSPRRVTFGRKASESETILAQAFRDEVEASIYTPAPATVYGQHVHEFEWKAGYEPIRLTTRTKVRFDDQPYHALVGPLAPLFTAIMPNPSNLWDLVIFSFAVDYFADIGKLLGAYSSLIDLHAGKVSAITHSYNFSCVDRTVGGANFVFTPSWLRSADGEIEYRLYMRFPSNYWPGITDSGVDFLSRRPSTNQVLTLGALVWVLK